MTKKEFEELIKRGLGRAIIILKRSDNIEKYKEIVLWSCLNYTGYCWQSEGSRGHYLYEAISNFEDKEYFQKHIIKAYQANLKDTHKFDQLTQLLFCFTQDGSIESRDKLNLVYHELFTIIETRKVSCNEINDSQRINFQNLCIWLIFLDGFDGFKKIINDLSKFFKRNPNKDPIYLDWFYAKVKNCFGKRKVETYLQKKGLFDIFNKHDCSTVSDNIVSKNITLEEIILICNRPWQEISRYLIRFARQASKEELENFSYILIKESNLEKKANMLWVFTLVPFVLTIDYVIEFTKSENKDLKKNAFSALEKIKSNKIREYALKLLEENQDIPEAISLICNNYQVEDGKLLEKYLKDIKINDSSDWHSAFGDITELIKNNKEAPKELLKYIYEKTLCSFCREYVVLAMNKRRIIDYKILKECTYDSNSEIREFAYRKIKNAKTNKYIVNLVFSRKSHYCLWYSDNSLIEDGFLTKNYQVITFSSEQECRNYANRKNIKVLEGPTVYELDGLIISENNCKKLLNAWNIMTDFAKSVYIDFEGEKQKYDDIYDELIFSSINREGYSSNLTGEVKDTIEKILLSGNEIIKNNICEM